MEQSKNKKGHVAYAIFKSNGELSRIVDIAYLHSISLESKINKELDNINQIIKKASSNGETVRFLNKKELELLKLKHSEQKKYSEQGA